LAKSAGAKHESPRKANCAAVICHLIALSVRLHRPWGVRCTTAVGGVYWWRGTYDRDAHVTMIGRLWYEGGWRYGEAITKNGIKTGPAVVSSCLPEAEAYGD
jgi:hypothetical protein